MAALPDGRMAGWPLGYPLISLIGQLTYQGSILGQNDLRLREIFLEVNCGHVSKKIEFLRPSCQKLEFCPYKEVGVALERFPRRIFLYIFIYGDWNVVDFHLEQIGHQSFGKLGTLNLGTRIIVPLLTIHCPFLNH